MRIPPVSGRDFRPEDLYPGATIVNQAFARECFKGKDPVGLPCPKRVRVVTDTVFTFPSDFDWQQPGEFRYLSD